jgi:hypothetical protein
MASDEHMDRQMPQPKHLAGSITAFMTEGSNAIAPNWHNREHFLQPEQESGDTTATCSALNIVGNSCSVIALTAMHPFRSQLQMPHMNGVWNVQTV